VKFPVELSYANKNAFFSKMENRKVNRSSLGVGTSGKGKDIRKRHRRMNMVEILYTNV
jgi:hypothetical protein